MSDRVQWVYSYLDLHPITDVWIDGKYSRLLGHVDMATARSIIEYNRRCVVRNWQ